MPGVSRHLRADLLLLLTAAIWGLGFVAQRVGAQHLGPFAFNAVRFGLGTVVLLPLLLGRGGSALGRPEPLEAGTGARADLPAQAYLPVRADVPARAGSSWVAGLLAGVAVFVASAFQQAGMSQTTAGKAGFITGLYLVLVPLAGLLLGHRTGIRRWLGAALAVAGLYLLSVTEALTMAPGDALVLAGAVCWAGHILVIDRFAHRTDAVALAFVQFAICSLLSLLVAMWSEPAPFAGLVDAWLPVLYGGVLSVGVGYTLQVLAQRAAPAAHAAILMSTEAVFAALGGAILLGEQMTGRGYLGCTLMAVGMVVSQLDRGLRPKRPEAGRAAASDPATSTRA